MLNRVLRVAVIVTVVFAIWKLCGGDVGVAASTTWDYAVRFFDWTSDALIKFLPSATESFDTLTK